MFTKRKIAQRLMVWRYRAENWPDEIAMAIVGLAPRRLLRWAVIRAAVMVEPNYSPAGVTAQEMLSKLY